MALKFDSHFGKSVLNIDSLRTSNYLEAGKPKESGGAPVEAIARRRG